MALPYQPWRAAYQPASFGGAGFHVEVDSQSGGRRNALHQFPHRDEPWAEDMGRKARRWSVAAYVIGPNYVAGRDALITACEQEGPLALVHPLLGTVQANCDDYACTERKELGGYAVFELRFVEAGSQPGTVVTADTQSQVGSAADQSDAAAVSSANGTEITGDQLAVQRLQAANAAGTPATNASTSASDSWSGMV